MTGNSDMKSEGLDNGPNKPPRPAQKPREAEDNWERITERETKEPEGKQWQADDSLPSPPARKDLLPQLPGVRCTASSCQFLREWSQRQRGTSTSVMPHLGTVNKGV